MSDDIAPCPLCHHPEDLKRMDGPLDRLYRLCGRCRLISVDPTNFPSREEEIARYVTHKNGIQYPGYVKFLVRALKPSLPYLSGGASEGLDYGCGPVPTMSILAKKNGINCWDYDPIFFPERPKGPFDIIFATECIEHFFRPADEFNNLSVLLKRGGLLTIMTETWTDLDRFATWYYSNDLTHVCFYHEDTIRYLADAHGFTLLESDRRRVFILRKK